MLIIVGMQKFSTKFEDHKIPEFYDRYFDYGACKKIIKKFKEAEPKLNKLDGFYNLDTASRKVKKLEISADDIDIMHANTKSNGQNLVAQSPEEQMELDGQDLTN